MGQVIDNNVLAELRSVAAAMEALGNETRLSISTLLVSAGRGGLPVVDVQEKLAIPASTLSHHISRLIHVSLVAQERQGRKLICRANYRCVEGELSFLTSHCYIDEGTTPGTVEKESEN